MPTVFIKVAHSLTTDYWNLGDGPTPQGYINHMEEEGPFFDFFGSKLHVGYGIKTSIETESAAELPGSFPTRLTLANWSPESGSLAFTEVHATASYDGFVHQLPADTIRNEAPNGTFGVWLGSYYSKENVTFTYVDYNNVSHEVSYPKYTYNAVQIPGVTVEVLDAAPSIETDTTLTSANFEIVLDRPLDVDVSINYTTLDGTASGGNASVFSEHFDVFNPPDYQRAQGTVVIPAGQTSATVVVPILDDLMAEKPEQFYLRATSVQAPGIDADQIVLARNTGTGTIEDPDGQYYAWRELLATGKIKFADRAGVAAEERSREELPEVNPELLAGLPAMADIWERRWNGPLVINDVHRPWRIPEKYTQHYVYNAIDFGGRPGRFGLTGGPALIDSKDDRAALIREIRTIYPQTEGFGIGYLNKDGTQVPGSFKDKNDHVHVQGLPNSFKGPTPENAHHFGSVAQSSTSPGGQIYAIYDGLLGRAPDTIGLQQNVDALTKGASIHDIARDILASSEGQLRFGGLSDRQFVEQLYDSAFHRQPDADGLSDWVTKLSTGMARADVALGFALSSENIAGLEDVYNEGIFVPDADAANVARLYYTVLGRAPDVGGLQTWTDLIGQGMSLQNVARLILGSDEYEVRSTGLTDSQFVEGMYQQILGRTGESEGVQNWSEALTQGTERAAVASAFINSIEFQSKFSSLDSAAYVQGLYHAALGRDGDQSGIANWTAALDSNNLTREDLSYMFSSSEEFSQKYVGPTDFDYVTQLYNNALERLPDLEGIQGWTNALANGASREDLAVGFSTSLEAKLHWTPSIEQGWNLA